MEPRYQQVQHSALHMAISFWREYDVAYKIAQTYSEHGDYIATVVLTSGRGFNVLDRAAEKNPKHLTIWGQPVSLARAVVAIVGVERT